MILTEKQVNKILKELEDNNMMVELVLFINWIRNNPDCIIRENNSESNEDNNKNKYQNVNKNKYQNVNNNSMQNILTNLIFRQLFPF